MVVKFTLIVSKGYLESFLTFLIVIPPLSTGLSAVTLPPIDDFGTGCRCHRNGCKRCSEQSL